MNHKSDSELLGEVRDKIGFWHAENPDPYIVELCRRLERAVDEAEVWQKNYDSAADESIELRRLICWMRRPENWSLELLGQEGKTTVRLTLRPSPEERDVERIREKGEQS